MKDFIKWLGNNEKVGKVIVWLLIITITLIILNTTLMSLGLPHYQITDNNINEHEISNILNFIFGCAMSVLNFYSIMLLVFSVKESKNMFKYAILYLILNCIISVIFNYAILQIFIVLYCIMFAYFYTNKNKKYILYVILSFIINAVVQSVWYMIKAQFVDYSQLNKLTQSILLSDYFIIMAIIILVKEIYLRKRGEQNARMLPMGRRIQQRKDICKKTSKKSIKSSQITNKNSSKTKK